MPKPPDITFRNILAARERIAPYAHRTPILTCTAIDEMAGCRLYFKCENFQKVGAFKFRGACNAVLSLSNEEASRGVVTHSSGNHAQALALAASIRSINAHIVMPSTAPRVKRDATEGYGAMVYECDPTLDAREAMTETVIKQHGATLVHPYNDPRIIAGQGTCALELLEAVSELPQAGRRRLNAIVAPIGGGGLMSGTCIAAQGFANHYSPTTDDAPLSATALPKGEGAIRLFGAEPAGADDAARSLDAGELIPQTGPNTIADGLLTSLGSHTWPIIRDHVARIFTVSDEEIICAMRLIWERMKIIVEPSSATVVAAVLSEDFQSLDGITNVGLILSGGNVDCDHLPWIK